MGIWRESNSSEKFLHFIQHGILIADPRQGNNVIAKDGITYCG
jgi:hypothetical protein